MATKAYLRVKAWRKRTKQRAVEYKGGKCAQCGYSKHLCALDFHHLNPKEKEFSISSATIANWDRIVRELDKCVLLCANCRREAHATED